MDEDPINNFFTPKEVEDPKILYTTLTITSTATSEDIRKAYRKLALRYHPDKHTTKNASEKEELGRTFQRVGFAYAVLSDEARRKRYDATGRTDDKFLDAEEMGWDAYFGTLFERLDGKMLNDHKAKYQESKEEEEDLIKAYEQHGGSLPKIMEEIPHSQYKDETRFITLINTLIASNTIKSTPIWKKTSTDEKASRKRAEKANKSAQDAENHAKELGIWDEMFGTGKKGKRKSDANGTETGEDGLAALILKRQKDREGGLDRLAEKYRKIEEEERAKKSKGKKTKGKKNDEDGHAGGPPEISDADFEALQAKLFGKNKKEKDAAKGASDISDAAFEKLQAEMFGKNGKAKKA